MSEWELVGNGTPVGPWLETKRDGEVGANICFCRVLCIGDEPEWIDREGYSTVVNSGTFAPPTHWRWPSDERMDALLNRGTESAAHGNQAEQATDGRAKI